MISDPTNHIDGPSMISKPTNHIVGLSMISDPTNHIDVIFWYLQISTGTSPKKKKLYLQRHSNPQYQQWKQTLITIQPRRTTQSSS